MHNEGEIPHGELAVVEDLDDLTHEGEHEEPPSIEKAEE